VQSFPSVIDAPDLDDMGQKGLSKLVETLTGRVTALENERSPANASNGKWGRNSAIGLASLAVSIVGLPLLLAAWIEPHLQNDLKNDVKIEVAEQLKEPLQDLHKMAADIAEIKGKLEVLDPLIQKLTAQRLTEAERLDSKELLARLPELKSLATFAKKESVTIKPETVEKVGKKLIEVGSPDAWHTALDFANYKSFLNVSLSLKVNNVIGTGTLATAYVTTAPPGMHIPNMSVAGAVPKDTAAYIRSIGHPDPNDSSPLGNDWIILEGGGLVIDGVQMRKTILRNVYVSYSGGQLQMQDVYFFNCIFGVTQQPDGQRFALALLSPSPATTFNAPLQNAGFGPSASDSLIAATHY
jgi:hypothetical protein